MFTLRLVHYALLLTPDKNLSHFLLLWTPHLEFTPTRHCQSCHILKRNRKPSSSHSISSPTNISTTFLLQSVCVCGGGGGGCVRACVCVFPYNRLPYYMSVNCFGRTVLYMCIEYWIWVNNTGVSCERPGR